MQAKLRELRSDHGQGGDGADGARSAMEANGGRIWSSSKPTTLRSRDRSCASSPRRSWSASRGLGTEPRLRTEPPRSPRSPPDAREAARGDASWIPSTRVSSRRPPRRRGARPGPRRRPARRASTSRSTFQCARRTRCTTPPRARSRAPGARGRIGGARGGWPDPPRPRRASGAETLGGAARLAARLRRRDRARARERPLDERASGRVAPRRERHDRAHGRRHDRARGRRGGRARRRAFYSNAGDAETMTFQNDDVSETFSDDAGLGTMTVSLRSRARVRIGRTIRTRCWRARLTRRRTARRSRRRCVRGAAAKKTRVVRRDDAKRKPAGVLRNGRADRDGAFDEAANRRAIRRGARRVARRDERGGEVREPRVAGDGDADRAVSAPTRTLGRHARRRSRRRRRRARRFRAPARRRRAARGEDGAAVAGEEQ